MTDTTQEELPPLPFQAANMIGINGIELRKLMTDYGKLCIATLKAENERLVVQQHEDYRKMRLAVEKAESAQSQAAAMAGLLLDMRQHQGSIQQYVRKIDAALAAWKKSSDSLAAGSRFLDADAGKEKQ